MTFNLGLGYGLRVTGPKFNWGRSSFSKTKSGVAEDDIALESDKEEGDKHFSHTPRWQQFLQPISKPFGEIIAAGSLEDFAKILGCQVTP